MIEWVGDDVSILGIGAFDRLSFDEFRNVDGIGKGFGKAGVGKYIAVHQVSSRREFGQIRLKRGGIRALRMQVREGIQAGHPHQKQVHHLAVVGYQVAEVTCTPLRLGIAGVYF